MPVELWTTVPWLDPDEAQDAAAKPPDGLFLKVLWPCGESGQIETPDSLLAALAVLS